MDAICVTHVPEPLMCHTCAQAPWSSSGQVVVKWWLSGGVVVPPGGTCPTNIQFVNFAPLSVLDFVFVFVLRDLVVPRDMRYPLCPPAPPPPPLIQPNPNPAPAGHSLSKEPRNCVYDGSGLGSGEAFLSSAHVSVAPPTKPRMNP